LPYFHFPKCIGLQEKVILYVLTMLSLVLPRIPVIGVFFRIVNTMIHETGHAVAALFTSGEVLNIDLFHDTSGAATTKSKSAVSRFIISIAGYFVSSIVAWLLFKAIWLNHINWVLFALLCIALVNLLFWVRNAFGILWLFLFQVLIFVVWRYADVFWQKAFVIFCSGVVLFDSVASAWVILYLSIKFPKQAGDAKNLADQTGIPAFFWALIFLLQALYFAYLVAEMYLGKILIEPVLQYLSL
jgi:hypothetical protein